MADRKEIFDYLRNQQKRDEIESKINGVNVWVLVGAIAFLVWQLIEKYGTSIWNKPALIVRSILCAVLTAIIIEAMNSSDPKTDEIRYVRWSKYSYPLAPLQFLSGLLMFSPALYGWFIFGSEIATISLTLLCGVSLVYSFVLFYNDISLKFNGIQRVPKLPFASPRSRLIKYTIILMAIFLAALGEQCWYLMNEIKASGAHGKEYLSILSLTGTLYLLFLILISRGHKLQAANWTYELETQLLLNEITTDFAANRIEEQTLGRAFQPIKDGFFRDLDNKLIAFNQSIVNRVALVQEISTQLEVSHEERAIKLDEATSESKNILVELKRLCDELGTNLNELDNPRNANQRNHLNKLIPDIRNRYAGYVAKVKDCQNRLSN